MATKKKKVEAPSKTVTMDDYEEQQKLIKDVYEAAAKAGLDEQDTDAYVMRTYNIDLSQMPIDDLRSCARALTDRAATLPMSKGENTSERVTGKPYTKDLVDQKEIERPWTQDEVDAMTEQLLQELSKVKALEAEKTEWVAEKNKSIKDHEALVNDLHEKLVRGTDISRREVRIHRNHETGKREIYDVKTGALVDEVPLTPADHQVDLDDVLEENARREEEADREGTGAQDADKELTEEFDVEEETA